MTRLLPLVRLASYRATLPPERGVGQFEAMAHPTSMSRTVAPVPAHRQPHNSQLVQTWGALDMYQEHMSINAISSGSAMYTAYAANNPQIASKQLEARRSYVEKATQSGPPPDYKGPRLSFPLTPGMLQSLVLHYVKDAAPPLHSSYLCSLLTQSRDLLAKRPRVTRIATRSGSHKRLVIVGDLHGQLPDLLTIFLENGFPSGQGTQYLINGDLVDRGPHGVEIATLLLAYKLLYPETIHINRGNHETSTISAQYGFMSEVMQKYNSTHIFGLFCQVFNQLPVCAVLDDSVVVMHGGLFRANGVELAHLEGVPREEVDLFSTNMHMNMLVDLLWTDPQENWGRSDSGRAAGIITFGPNVTADFLKKNRMKLLIRSHQVPSTGRGYEDLHNGQLITVFSASNYCGTQGNWGGVVVFDQPGTYTLREYMAPDLQKLRELMRKVDFSEATPVHPNVGDPSSIEAEQVEEKVRQQVAHQLHQIIAKHKDELAAYWRRKDPTATGLISLDIWKQGLNSVIKLNKPIEWTAHTRELGLILVEGKVAWKQFLRKYEVQIEGKWVDEMKRTVFERLTQTDVPFPELFKLLELTEDGMVDLPTLEAALPKLGLNLSPEQLQQLLPGAERGKKVDVSTWIQSLAPSYAGDPVSPEVREVFAAIERTLGTSCKNLLDMFQKLDLDKNGVLDLNEIREIMLWLSRNNPQYAKFNSPQLAGEVMKAVDRNQSGTVSLLEFLSLFQPAENAAESRTNMLVQQVAQGIYKHRDELSILFYQLDVTGDGHLDREEFKQGLKALTAVNKSLTDHEIELVAAHVDKDSDGKISFEEFLAAFAIPNAATPATPRSGGSVTPRQQATAPRAAEAVAAAPVSKTAEAQPICKRVSEQRGACPRKAIKDSRFCDLHTCPACRREKPSFAKGCSRHSQGVR